MRPRREQKQVLLLSLLGITMTLCQCDNKILSLSLSLSHIHTLTHSLSLSLPLMCAACAGLSFSILISPFSPFSPVSTQSACTHFLSRSLCLPRQVSNQQIPNIVNGPGPFMACAPTRQTNKTLTLHNNMSLLYWIQIFSASSPLSDRPKSFCWSVLLSGQTNRNVFFFSKPSSERN